MPNRLLNANEAIKEIVKELMKPINELKKQGYVITMEYCSKTGHPKLRAKKK